MGDYKRSAYIMERWACGIEGCGRGFEAVEPLIRHQATDHPECECKVCGETVPAGYPAIHHAFEEHTRAEYVRAYNADSDEIRLRENLIDRISETIDLASLLGDHPPVDEAAVTVGD